MNIVVITTHYPKCNCDNGNTSLADHYFAREWVKAGHNVRVYHIQPALFLKTKNNVSKQFETYEIDNVSIKYLKVLRPIPHSTWLPNCVIKRVASQVIADLQDFSDQIDLFFCDFCSDNWGFISFLKNSPQFRDSWFVPVFNNCDFKDAKLARKIVDESDVIGVRSQGQKQRILDIDRDADVFVALSGAPVCSAEQISKKINNLQAKQIVYAGNLIPLKNVDVLLKAVNMLKDNYDLLVTIVGDGVERAALEQFVNDHELSDIITFTGVLPRQQTLEMMLEGDIFAMASSPETFGIVYLEAMANACYPIGCIGEGIDGVIKTGYNGALVPARDVDALAQAIREYICLSQEEKKVIIANALNTADAYSEKNVANMILKDIVELWNKKLQKKKSE